MPFYDFDNLTNTAVGPNITSNEALRRILYLLNQVAHNGDTASELGSTVVSGVDSNGLTRMVSVDANGKLQIDFAASDIEIGAVELKDALNSYRAIITAAGELTVTDPQNKALLSAIDATLTLINTNTDGLEALISSGNINTNATAIAIGDKTDAPAATDTGTYSHIALLKRALQSLTSLVASSSGTQSNTGNVAVSVGSIDTKTPSLVSGRVPVDGSGVTQPVSLASVPLPTGAATETTLSDIKTNTTVSKGAGATDATTQRVVVANDQTIPISASALPLPSGAATESTLSGLSAKIPAQGAALISASIPVNIASNQTVPVSMASVPLPTGAATLAEQQSQTTSLGTIATEIGATNEAAAATDTSTSGLNGLLKRQLQQMTTLIAGTAVTSSGNGAATTNSTGSVYTALTTQACKTVHILNYSLVDVEVQQGGAGVSNVVRSDTGMTFRGLSNASNLAVRRVDQSNSQVNINYRWEA